MPPLPNVPNVLKADVGWQIGADLAALTRLHISYTGTPPTGATCVTLAHDLHSDIAATLLPYMVSSNNLLSVRLTDLTSPTSGQGIYSATLPGTSTHNIIGADVSVLASMTIGRRYRGGKPRSYLPLGGDGDLATQQTWTTTFVSNVQASLDGLRSDIAATSFAGCALVALVNVSYYQGFTLVTNPITGRGRNVPKLRVGGPIVDAATNWVCENRLSSQRRRNLRQS
jgi:hypothetical protein